MPILLSRSKHEEFESNSALQIINQKERRAEEARKMKHAKKLRRVQKFSQGAKISYPAKLLPGFVIFGPF